MKKTILSVCFVVGAMVSANAQSVLYPQHFDLNEVTLADGPLRTSMLTNAQLLLQYDAARLMTPFVRQAGLSATSDSNSPYYQWETKHPSFSNWGLPSWSLEGHVGGHYLTALALAHAALNTPADAPLRAQIKERLDYCLAIMKDCQEAYDTNTAGLYGFIGGQPINQVWTGLYSGNTSAFSSYGGWVPFYCQHKVLAGLRDAWVYAGSEVAKELFRKMSDWSCNVIANLTDTQMQNNVLSSEHGGMNEVIADAYDITGESKYLECARRFSHKRLLTPLSQRQDCLDNLHANTQIPKFTGFESVYNYTDDINFRRAARFFWQTVVDQHTWVNGGNSTGEHFFPTSEFEKRLTNAGGPESCNSVNMMRLTESLSLKPEVMYFSPESHRPDS